jgi:hypothetical protein
MKLLYCTDIFDAAVQHAGRIDICSAVGGESDWLTVNKAYGKVHAMPSFQSFHEWESPTDHLICVSDR